MIPMQCFQYVVSLFLVSQRTVIRGSFSSQIMITPMLQIHHYRYIYQAHKTKEIVYMYIIIAFKRQAKTKAQDLAENGVEIELMHIGQSFDVSLFYRVSLTTVPYR